MEQKITKILNMIIRNLSHAHQAKGYYSLCM